MTDLASPVLAAAPIDAAHPHYRWISLAMFAGGFATFSMLYSVQALMPLFAQTFHLSAAVASMTLSASSLTLALCMIPAGILSDQIGRKPLTVKLAELMGAMRFCWTSHEWAHEKKNDAVIFEYYKPGVKFKK